MISLGSENFLKTTFQTRNKKAHAKDISCTIFWWIKLRSTYVKAQKNCKAFLAFGSLRKVKSLYISYAFNFNKRTKEITSVFTFFSSVACLLNKSLWSELHTQKLFARRLRLKKGKKQSLWPRMRCVQWTYGKFSWIRLSYTFIWACQEKNLRQTEFLSSFSICPGCHREIANYISVFACWSSQKALKLFSYNRYTSFFVQFANLRKFVFFLCSGTFFYSGWKNRSKKNICFPSAHKYNK